ncbi:MAG: hypothetical protein RLY20_3410 [Verrucomicrobiota bacterium]|jgi:hypothetical protein
MQPLAQQRCFNHAEREAAARCPECKRDYCRECVTEYDDRLICTSCLQKLAAAPTASRRSFAGMFLIVRCAASVFLLWFLFYLIGEGLSSLPDSFHQGTLWQVHWFERE